jgi:hypothetical protein
VIFGLKTNHLATLFCQTVWQPWSPFFSDQCVAQLGQTTLGTLARSFFPEKLEDKI